MNYNDLAVFTKNIQKFIVYCICIISLSLIYTFQVYAFPIYAQQGYDNPREATGRIVCANCHLAQKPVHIETPKAVLPNSIFEATVEIPYDTTLKQPLGNGEAGSLNVGAVLILPDGFKLAPKKLLSKELKQKTKNVYIQPYSTSKQNILLVGPIPGDTNQSITFPILSPDPSTDKNIHFFKYPIYLGGNRGRGQIYPTGDKSNNNPISTTNSGKIIKITNIDNGGYNIEIEKNNGEIYQEKIPSGFQLTVSEGSNITSNQIITNDPNVGGFGQDETEIVLQNPNRIKGMIGFFFTVTLAQIFFVLKKKQWEKVQAADLNF
uniref:Cytochrome f n=1 Tax=Ceramothamnion japonicum TaxID=218448 RepID=A0A1C9CD35_CERJP|nr:cytochrome f [Ceramium japonicum]AOM66301.1 cytochrome f [Ceramium japonicum]